MSPQLGDVRVANPLGGAVRWPKQVPQLTAEQQRIRDDFMRHWLEVLPNRYGLIEKFNHRYPLRSIVAGGRTLEIGAGIGAHCNWEDLSSQEYYCNELRPELLEQLVGRFPQVTALLGDCQVGLDIPDDFFDRVLAIHVLEHLPKLPSALDNIHRMLRPGGCLSVVIPCEGGAAYTLARNISARRIFERRYRQSYDWFVASEHLNLPHEITQELAKRFVLTHRLFFPLRLPIVNANLVIGLTLLKL
jgi:SAM-dependent methyltransferase